MVKESNETTDKEIVSFLLQLRKKARWLPAKIILWQNNNVYLENQILFANIL